MTNITKSQYRDLKKFAARHGLHNEQTLFKVVKDLNYQTARNAIVCWAICQGVA